MKNVLQKIKKRAENGTRTRDPDLGKVVLYQLSYFRNTNPYQKGASLSIAGAKVIQNFEPTKFFRLFFQKNS